VASDTNGIDAHGPKCLLSLRAGVQLPAGHNDPCARPSESLGDGTADPTGASRDNGDPSIESEESIEINIGVFVHCANFLRHIRPIVYEVVT
jgi:hypothetical protein